MPRTKPGSRGGSAKFFYQIYPRSFQDSNGDGSGDLAGIRRRLDYLCWLGVGAIWICPFFRSPMADGGYDIIDHCDIDPLFGSMDDFTELLDDAHARGLNMGGKEHSIAFDGHWRVMITTFRDRAGETVSGRLTLRPHEGLIAEARS